jgi:multimeric flavodoxin WrbA
MKIVVLNGSPKGRNSVTMQYLLYIKKKYPQHEVNLLKISSRIKKYEKKEEEFNKILDEIDQADIIIWGTPVYVMLVPYQLKRFIELIEERGKIDIFRNKYTAIITTSIRFYDSMAINYLHGIIDDWNMKFAGFFSADSYDLLHTKERTRLLKFFDYICYVFENKIETPKQYFKISPVESNYDPTINESDSNFEKLDIGEKSIRIITDSGDLESNLGKMVSTFQSFFSKPIEVINLNDINIKGGCLGCLHCAYDNVCAYGDKDEYMNFYNAKIPNTDIIIFAGNLVDRYLSSRWKLFFDRAFFNTHIPTMINSQLAYIISGSLSENTNLHDILRALSEFQRANLEDIVTDEKKSSEEIKKSLYDLAKRLKWCVEHNYIKPKTFLGEGGMKIFRDDVWGRNRFVFQADHKFYTEHGYYDSFPQNDIRAEKTNEYVMNNITNDPDKRTLFYQAIVGEFVKPFKKVLKNPDK